MFILRQGQQTSFVKGHIVKILGFAGHTLSAATTSVCHGVVMVTPKGDQPGACSSPSHRLRAPEAWSNNNPYLTHLCSRTQCLCCFPVQLARESPTAPTRKLLPTAKPAQLISLVGDSFQKGPEDRLRKGLLVGTFLPFPSGLSSDVLGMQAVDKHGLQGTAHGIGISIFAGDCRVRGHVLLLQRLHRSH